MEQYIWTMFGLSCLNVVTRLFALSILHYPRTTTYEQWEDILSAVISGVFVMWAWSVLHV